MAKKKEENTEQSSVYDVIKLIGATEIVDEIQRKFRLAASTTDVEARRSTTVSTGLLMTDIVLNGGIYPAGWYTFFGGEGSAKSSTMMNILSSVYGSNVPLIDMRDAEGSTSADYIETMARSSGVAREFDVKKAFGVSDPKTGKWVIPPRIRYTSDNSLEGTWKSISAILKRLPDKAYIDGDWWLLFDRTKENISKFKGQGNKKIGDQYNKIAIKSLDGGSMQALFIVDSLPALVAEADDEDEGTNAMAISARGHAKHIPKVKGRLKRKHCTILVVNQIRLNPGAMMGNPEYEPCFIGSTNVLLADGTTDTIRNIVLKKRKVKVLSFDKNTGKVSAKRIIDWKNNGYKPIEDIISLTYQSYKANGALSSSSVTCTKNHKFWTPTGWCKAEDLDVGSTVFINAPTDVYTSDRRQVLYGSLLGDGVFYSEDDSLKWQVQYTHVRYQVPYMLWKASMLDYGDPHTIYNDSNVQHYKRLGKESSYFTFPNFNRQFAKYARILRSNHTDTGKQQQKLIAKILAKLDLRGLAVWYQDDGHFSNDAKNGMVVTITCDRFTEELKQYAIERITELTGVEPSVDSTHGKLTIKGMDNIKSFLDALSPYIHPSMAYKVMQTDSVFTYDWETGDPKVVNKLLPVKILAKRNPDLKSKKVAVFDLTIEDNHTYFVGGSVTQRELARQNTRTNRGVKADCIAVSNCGQAPKFASDVRIKHTARSVPHGKGSTEEEDSVQFKSGVDTYRYIHLRAIKNKYGTPNVEAWHRLWLSDPIGKAHGFCPVWDTYQYLVATGQLEGTMGRGFTITLGKWTSPKLKWLDFKMLILLEGKALKEECGRLGIDKNPKIRETCFKQIRSGEGLDLYYQTISGLNEEDEVPYDEWDDSEIIDEVVERGLMDKKNAKKSKIKDLIKLLEADDLNEEDDEEGTDEDDE